MIGLLKLRRELDLLRMEAIRGQQGLESVLVDLALLSEQDRLSLGRRNADIAVLTDRPVAYSSADHVAPRGTATDVTRAPAFVEYCERLYGGSPSYLDLGCSGGGVVLDFVLRGHVAIGLEGSDYSKRTRRAAWRIIPSNLFTCDICAPYRVVRSGAPASFDVVGAWEVLEHIPSELLPGMLSNVAAHMHGESLFMASVATFPDADLERGIVWHVTVKPRDWWMARFAEAGLEPADVPFDSLDMPRGSGLGPFDWSAVKTPEMGFHVVLRRIRGPSPGTVTRPGS